MRRWCREDELLGSSMVKQDCIKTPQVKSVGHNDTATFSLLGAFWPGAPISTNKERI